MEGCEQEVVEAIESPDFGISYIDRDYPNRRVYYKISKTQDYYTKVVVEFGNSEEIIGQIITAFQPDEITTVSTRVLRMKKLVETDQLRTNYWRDRSSSL